MRNAHVLAIGAIAILTQSARAHFTAPAHVTPSDEMCGVVLVARRLPPPPSRPGIPRPPERPPKVPRLPDPGQPRIPEPPRISPKPIVR